MSAPDPQANPDLLGHRPAEEDFAAAARAQRLHHAWLITGPAGIGKSTFAFRAARWLFAGQPAGEGLYLDPAHRMARLVAAGSHPDLIRLDRNVYERSGRRMGEISAETARQVPGFLRLTPAEGAWRVVVVPEAERLNVQSSNALLKAIEEPPPRAVILLCATSRGAVLPTIRSRCRHLPLAPLPEAECVLRLMTSKCELRRMLVLGCEANAKSVTLHLRDDTPLDAQKILGLVKGKVSPWKITPDMRLTRRFDGSANGLVNAEQMLVELSRCWKD